MLFVPCAEPVLKVFPIETPAPALRLAMVRALVADDARFEASDVEIRRSGASYTVDTLREVAARHPGAELVFLVGADALAQLPNWRDPEELQRRCVFAAHVRPGTRLVPPPGFRVHPVPGDEISISSSDLRRRLMSARAVQPDLPRSVCRVIEAEQLYAPAVSPGLRAHIETVVAAGVTLAARWAQRVGDVELACRYHDFYRGETRRSLLALAAGCDEPIDAMDRQYPILLHGRMAARRLESTGPGAPSENRQMLVEAVRWHTTGRSGMSAAEETVLIADQVGKIWDTVDDVPMEREAAMRAALTRKLAKGSKNGEKPHPLLVAAAIEHGIVANADDVVNA